MCGIFGVWGHQRAAALTHLGLYSLQHRGQESAGIVAVGPDGAARSVRKMGLVSEGFAGADVANLPGPSPSDTRGTAPPARRRSTTRSRCSRVSATATSRSRITGTSSMLSSCGATSRIAGSIFSSSMDSEVIVHLMARSSSTKPEHRLADAMARVDGASSLLVVVGNTLIAARDPRGWRPLVMGRLGDAYVFASETCALDIVGATVEREVKPGEIIAIDRDGFRIAAGADAAAQALRLRARLFRAAGQLRLRRLGRPRAPRTGSAAGEGAAGARSGTRLLGA